jgi:hypothetical protein
MRVRRRPKEADQRLLPVRQPVTPNLPRISRLERPQTERRCQRVLAARTVSNSRVIRAVVISLVLFAVIAVDEGTDILTSNAWWLPVFLAVWVGSNIAGNLIARILSPVRGSLSVWRYRVSLDLEPKVTRRFRDERRES